MRPDERGMVRVWLDGGAAAELKAAAKQDGARSLTEYLMRCHELYQEHKRLPPPG